MTNWEYMQKAINDEFDDGGASQEAAVYYYIECPYYYGDPKAKCKDDDNPTREKCYACKLEWLQTEVE